MLRAWLTALAVLAGIGFSSAADSKSPLEHDKRWVEARNDLRQGKTAEAKTEFEELLKQYPNEPDLHLFVGMSLLRLRDPRAALSAIKKAIDIDPNHIEARTLLGYVELEVRGDADAAATELYIGWRRFDIDTNADTTCKAPVTGGIIGNTGKAVDTVYACGLEGFDIVTAGARVKF